jgi:preprotein translocase subunit SecE
MLVFPQTKDIFRTASLIVLVVVILPTASFAAVDVVERTLKTLIIACKWDSVTY